MTENDLRPSSEKRGAGDEADLATPCRIADRHRERLERHADSDRPSSWIAEALLASVSEGTGDQNEEAA